MKKFVVVALVFAFAIFGAVTLTHSSAAHATSTGSYNPVTPTRLYDTRIDGNQKPLPDSKPVTINILDGSGLPKSGVSAVMLNVHAIPTGSRGSFSAYASDGSRPSDGMLLFGANKTASSQMLVPVGPDGAIKVWANARVDVVIEVQGWVGFDSTAAPDKLTTFDAYSVLSTRDGLGRSRPIAKSTTMKVKVAGIGPVPASAKAVVLNMVAYGPTSDGNIYVKAAGETAGNLSMLAVSNNQNVANQVIVPVGNNGSIEIASTVSRTDLAVAIEGYYSSGTTSVMTAIQVLNTVNARDPLVKGVDTRLKLAGQNGIPANAAAVSVHFAVVSGGSDGELSIMPYGSVIADYDQYMGTQPKSRAMYFPANSTISNTITVPLGPDGSVALKSNVANTNVVVDVVGWVPAPSYAVTPPVSAGVACSANTENSVPTDTQMSNQILNNTNKYAMGTWWAGDAATLLKDPLNTDTSRSSSDPVRRLSMEAFSLATSLSTCAYNPAITGVSKEVAMQRTVQLISYVASRHISNRVDGWGGGWQGALWTAYAGRAAWLVWSSLPAATQSQVAHMVRFEAEDAMGKNTDYLRDASGAYLKSAGDTGAEDTAWWAMPIQLATVMFPNDSQSSVWKYAYIHYALAAWARPDDTANSTVVNGQPIGSWIAGSNVEENGIVYNHQRVAPDYMTNIYQTMDDVWLQSFAGNAAPLADVALIAPVYDAYGGVMFDQGTIYVPNSSTIYYPQGIDWGTGQELPYALADLQTATYGDATDTQLAKQYEQLHQQAELNMQNRFSDGRTYANDTEYTYVGREEHTAQLAAQFYLTTVVRDYNLSSFTNQAYTGKP